MTFATYDFSPNLVVLSYGISFLGAYVAISLCEQLRQSMMADKAKNGSRVSINFRKKNLLLLFLMSISISGVGIWSMHFIGMHALMLYDKDGEMVEMKYNITLSILSFICVLFTTFVGMTTASYDVMFSKKKQEIVELIISDTQKLSMSEIRRIDFKKLLLLISTKRLGRLLFGGFITGSGVSIMHYLGMLAMIFDGYIVWNPALVFASVLVAIVAATVAFWIFFRLLSVFPEMEILRITSALIMGIAVCGMHYTGMAAASYEYNARFEGAVRRDMLKNNMANRVSYSSALVGANLMLWLITMYILWNSRYVNQRQAKLLHRADQLAQQILSESSSAQGGSAAHGVHHSNPVLGPSIRAIADQYMAKRFLKDIQGKRKKQVHAMEDGASFTTISESQRSHTSSSFTQFIGYSLYWLLTGKWSNLHEAWFIDGDDCGHSSVNESESAQHDNSFRRDSRVSESSGGKNSFRRGNANASSAIKYNSQDAHQSPVLLLSVKDQLKPVFESEKDCSSNANAALNTSQSSTKRAPAVESNITVTATESSYEVGVVSQIPTSLDAASMHSPRVNTSSRNLTSCRDEHHLELMECALDSGTSDVDGKTSSRSFQLSSVDQYSMRSGQQLTDIV